MLTAALYARFSSRSARAEGPWRAPRNVAAPHPMRQQPHTQLFTSLSVNLNLSGPGRSASREELSHVLLGNLEFHSGHHAHRNWWPDPSTSHRSSLSSRDLPRTFLYWGLSLRRREFGRGGRRRTQCRHHDGLYATRSAGHPSTVRLGRRRAPIASGVALHEVIEVERLLEHELGLLRMRSPRSVAMLSTVSAVRAYPTTSWPIGG